MKLIKKLAAGLLLSVGFLCLLITVDELLDQDTTQQEKVDLDTAIGGIALGIPLVATGGCLVWGLYKQGKKEVSDRLQSTFFRLIQAGNGYITVFHFAMEAQLTAIVAKQYLDEKAKEFDASFDVNNEGAISYHFSGLITPCLAASTSTTVVDLKQFDLILEDSGNNKIAVIKLIRELTGLGLKEAKDLVEATPTIVTRGIARRIAQNIKKQLEAVGAKVTVK